jgi:amino acid adenylation domain-containing protein
MTGALSVVQGGTVPPLPAREGVFARYEHWVGESPAAVAVQDGPYAWTYREIDDVANEVIRHLEGRVGAGDLVAVCLDRSAALVAVAVAVARLGAVYLPLGHQAGERRLTSLLAELRVPAVIGSPELLPGSGEQVKLPVPASGANAVAVTVAEFTTPAPDALPAPPDAFYAVLTSGSTGTPKAVAVGGESLANLVRWYHDLSGLGPGDRMSLLMAVPFDPHLGDLWAGLSHGATLAVAPDEVRYSTERLVEWYRSAAVDVSVLATPMAEPVLSGPWPHGLRLRDLLIGGDRLRSWPRPGVTARIHNVYGPAEATINVTAATLEPGLDMPAPPIGTPIPGVTLCVVDGDGRIVERGQPGELLIGGTCLALGYLDESLTRERFVPGPEGADVARVYRTGDKVRMRADGVLEFLGRLDDQVKISGVRIEPAEVETALEQHPAVRRAVVAVRRHQSGLPGLVAYVEPVPGMPLDTAEVLSTARASLPHQAVPGDVHAVDGFPLNQNGKVDRAALLAATASEPAGEPAGETQLRLAELWHDILGADGLHPGSNFFELGGNSMHAVALTSAVTNTFHVDLSMKTIMSLRSLRDMAAAIDAERRRSLAVPEGTHTTVTEW